MSTKETRNPKVVLNNVNVTNLIYAPIPKVYDRNGKKFTEEHLHEIQEALNAAKETSFKRIRLVPVESNLDFVPPFNYLEIELKERVLIKKIVRVKVAESKDSAVRLSVKTIWPTPEKEKDVVISDDFKGIQKENGSSKLYLNFIGPRWPEWKSFTERMNDKYDELENLVKCWCNGKNHCLFEFDDKLKYWLSEFSAIHGDSFNQRKVWDLLVQTTKLRCEKISRIREIYNKNPRFGKRCDLINPLFTQMKNDILADMYKDWSFRARILANQLPETKMVLRPVIKAYKQNLTKVR